MSSTIEAGMVQETEKPLKVGGQPGNKNGSKGHDAQIFVKVPGSFKARCVRAANRAGQNLTTWLIETLERSIEPAKPELDEPTRTPTRTRPR